MYRRKIEPFSVTWSIAKAPRWRGPAAILEVGDTGATATFQSQTDNVARSCVRRQVGPKVAGGVNRNPASGNSDTLDGKPSVLLGKTLGNDRAVTEGAGGPSEPSTTSPREQSGVNGDPGSPLLPPIAALAPSSPSLFIQAPSSPPLAVQVPPGTSSSDRNCAELPVPVDTRGDYDHFVLTNSRIFAEGVAARGKIPKLFRSPA